VRRVVCAWPLAALTEAHVDILRELERAHDELIVVVTDADEAYTPRLPLSAGERIARALPVLRAQLKRPFYLLPVKRGALSEAQYATRIRLYAPRFHTFVCDDEAQASVRARVLGCAVQTVALPAAATVHAPGSAVRRGLFVTRAQPFHLGHRAFVRQILSELDEVIVLVSKANISHSVDNPATAGERLELIQPLLEVEARGRYHLCAAPYVDDDGANFAELALILPPFEAVYTNSPSTAQLAISDGIRVVALAAPLSVSGTEVRRRMIAGEPYDDLLPPEVARALLASPMLARLRALAQPEARG